MSIRQQRELLKHHTDAGGHGVERRGKGDGLAVDDDVPAVRWIESIEQAHQRALAGAVLAEQRQHLAGENVEIDLVVGDHGAEAFDDAAHGYQR